MVTAGAARFVCGGARGDVGGGGGGGRRRRRAFVVAPITDQKHAAALDRSTAERNFSRFVARLMAFDRADWSAAPADNAPR